MPEREIVVDHRFLFRSFLTVLLGYALLWATRFAGFYLFDSWDSMRTDDLFSWLLIFWIPVLLFLIILVTLHFAVFEDDREKASMVYLYIYAAILLAITVYIWWAVTELLVRGFT